MSGEATEVSLLLQDVMNSEDIWKGIWSLLRWDTRKVERIYGLFSRHCHPSCSTSLLKGNTNKLYGVSYVPRTADRVIPLNALELCFYSLAPREYQCRAPQLTALSTAFFGALALNSIQFLRLCALCSAETSHDVTHPCGFLRLAGIFQRYDTALKGYLTREDFRRLCYAIYVCSGALRQENADVLYDLICDTNDEKGVSFSSFVRAVHSQRLSGTSYLLRMSVVPQPAILSVITSKCIEYPSALTSASTPLSTCVSDPCAYSAPSFYGGRTGNSCVSTSCNIISPWHTLNRSRSTPSNGCLRAARNDAVLKTLKAGVFKSWTFPLASASTGSQVSSCLKRSAPNTRSAYRELRALIKSKSIRTNYCALNLSIPPLASSHLPTVVKSESCFTGLQEPLLSKTDLTHTTLAGPLQVHPGLFNDSSKTKSKGSEADAPCAILIDVQGPADRPWKDRCYMFTPTQRTTPAQNTIENSEKHKRNNRGILMSLYWQPVLESGVINNTACLPLIQRPTFSFRSALKLKMLTSSVDDAVRTQRRATQRVQSFARKFQPSTQLSIGDRKLYRFALSKRIAQLSSELYVIACLFEDTAQYICSAICEYYLARFLHYRSGTFALLFSQLCHSLWFVFLACVAKGFRLLHPHKQTVLTRSGLEALQFFCFPSKLMSRLSAQPISKQFYRGAFRPRLLPYTMCLTLVSMPVVDIIKLLSFNFEWGSQGPLACSSVMIGEIDTASR